MRELRRQINELQAVIGLEDNTDEVRALADQAIHSLVKIKEAHPKRAYYQTSQGTHQQAQKRQPLYTQKDTPLNRLEVLSDDLGRLVDEYRQNLIAFPPNITNSMGEKIKDLVSAIAIQRDPKKFNGKK